MTSHHFYVAKPRTVTPCHATPRHTTPKGDLPGLAVEEVRLRGKSLTESMVSSADAAKEEDMERLLMAMMGELEGEKEEEERENGEEYQ